MTLIVFTGAAVPRHRLRAWAARTGPNCYQNGTGLTAELDSHAWIEFGNRMLSGFVALAATKGTAGPSRDDPFRRDLAVPRRLLPLGVVAQGVLGQA